MITQNESLSLPEFEDRLWDELSQLHGDDQPDENDAGSHNKPRNRSPRRRYLVAAATVALAGLGATVAVAVTSDPDAADVTTPSQAPPPPDAIVVTESRVFGKVAKRAWSDESTGNGRTISYGANGEPEQEGGGTYSISGSTISMRGTTLDHVQGEYFEDEETYPIDDCPVDSGPYRGDGCVGPPGSYREDFLIRRQLEDGGDLREDGFEIVDGRRLRRLVGTRRTPDDHVVWVDPETYRPVKDFQTIPVDEGAVFEGHTVPPGVDSVEYITTYEYLDRTAENLELLEVEIPEDYVPYSPGL